RARAAWRRVPRHGRRRVAGGGGTTSCAAPIDRPLPVALQGERGRELPMGTTAVASSTRRDAGLTATELLAPPPADPRMRRRPDGALEALPPAEDCRCGQRRWQRLGYQWHASCCGVMASVHAPTDAEIAAADAADREYRRRVEAVQANADEHAARRRFERHRDRRPLATVRAGMRAALLHRANPARYPLTPAAREWAGDRLLD